MRRVELSDAERRAVAAGRFVRVDLGARVEAAGGVTRSALVGRVEGRAVAWANICQHNPVPLDLPDVAEPDGDGVRAAPMSEDGASLMCHSHGALFRPADGLCVLGPCYGQRLCRLEIQEQPGAIAILLP